MDFSGARYHAVEALDRIRIELTTGRPTDHSLWALAATVPLGDRNSFPVVTDMRYAGKELV